MQEKIQVDVVVDTDPADPFAAVLVIVDGKSVDLTADEAQRVGEALKQGARALRSTPAAAPSNSRHT